MSNSPLKVQRRPEVFSSDDRRVITRFFVVGGEDRIKSVLNRVMALSEQQVVELLEEVMRDFASRHKGMENVLAEHYERVAGYLDDDAEVSPTRQLLIGAYFTMEYSIESAALFNPSIVPHPDQTNLPEGARRFVISLRATGEGHISSIVFRTGVIHRSGEITFDQPSRFASRAKVIKDRTYDKHTFKMSLAEMGVSPSIVNQVMRRLDEQFTFRELSHQLAEVRAEQPQPEPFVSTSEIMLWLARSNYHLKLPPDADPSEVVIFPASENESKGSEDVRFVQFTDDDGKQTYFGTYTAYNGLRVLTQLIETDDFHHLKIHTLNGRFSQSKGMALFPRKINGKYVMINRHDGENLYIMESDNPHFWYEARPLQVPKYPWEFVQIGNCGSPIETEHGWILLTHGVGPMREYSIGATMLDLDDPSKIIGHLPEPLLAPAGDERDGYVPNVVYTCGAMIQGENLIIPYAMSDTATKFATVNLQELIDRLLASGSLSEHPACFIERRASAERRHGERRRAAG